MKQLDCTILFRLIRENIDDEGKEIMREFIKQDMVKKMRCISLEITKMRGLCISQQTLEETRQTLKKGEYDEAADAFMMFISTGNYADLKLIAKRDKKFIIGFTKELLNLANPTLSEFFATETW